LHVKKEIFNQNRNVDVLVFPHIMKVGGFVFEWSSQEGLLYEGKPAAEKLSAIVGADMTNILDTVRTSASRPTPPHGTTSTSAPQSTQRRRQTKNSP